MGFYEGDESVKLNLGSGTVVKEGFVSVDKFQQENVEQIQDLFSYPWIWDNDSIGGVYASHLIEHIPHDPSIRHGWALTRGMGKWAEKLATLDGFFCFFAEVWRICQHGAEVECIAPFGMSVRALQDPGHRRSIVAETVSYLTPGDDRKGTFSYALPFLYESVTISLRGNPAVEYMANLGNSDPAYGAEAMARVRMFWNQAEEIRFVLKVVKDKEFYGRQTE